MKVHFHSSLFFLLAPLQRASGPAFLLPLPKVWTVRQITSCRSQLRSRSLAGVLQCSEDLWKFLDCLCKAAPLEPKLKRIGLKFGLKYCFITRRSSSQLERHSLLGCLNVSTVFKRETYLTGSCFVSGGQ